MKYHLLHASDLHGSNLCFSNLISMARLHRPRFVVISGDLTGKSLTPVVPVGGSKWKSRFGGEDRTLKEGTNLYEYEEDVSNSGSYPIRIPEADAESLRNNPAELDNRLSEERQKRLSNWIDFADSDLPDEVSLVMICGNDDPMSSDQVFAQSTKVVNPDWVGSVEVEGYRFFGESRANETPWKCPRDYPDFDLEELLTKRLEGHRDFERAIFVFHSPPYASGLDNAPVLKDGRAVTRGAETVMTPVGSPAVRRAIERCQPLLGLHGHVHESAAIIPIGRTICSNPGSDYNRGFLRLAWITLEESRVVDYHLQTV
jgi:uncharacterized protein